MAAHPPAPANANDDGVPFRAAPALAWLATLAAVVDAVGTRLLLRLANDPELLDVSHQTLLLLKRLGDMSRNLAGIAGLIALGLALMELIQPRTYVPLYQRIGFAGFAGVFLPTILLATILPAERTTVLVVLVAAGAANMLVLALSLSALRWKAPWGLRVGMGLTGAAAFFAFISLTTLIIGRLTLWEAAYPLGTTLRHIGEAFFVPAVIALSVGAFPRELRGVRRGSSVAIGVAVGVVVGTAYALPPAVLTPERWAELLYGATHASLFTDSVPYVYAIGFGSAAALCASAVLSDDSSTRQVALGTFLVLGGGYAPSTPVTLLMLVLGVTLLARSVVAKSVIQWRARTDSELQDLARDMDAEMDAEMDELERA